MPTIPKPVINGGAIVSNKLPLAFVGMSPAGRISITVGSITLSLLVLMLYSKVLLSRSIYVFSLSPLSNSCGTFVTISLSVIKNSLDVTIPRLLNDKS